MPRRGPLLALLLAPLLVVGPSLLRGRWFLPQVPAAFPPLSLEDPARAARAVAGQSYPESDRLYPALTDQAAMRRELRRGHLPTWEPLLGLGVPLFAQSIAGAAYPPNWLAFLLPPERAAGPLALLSLFLAGLGAWLFLSRIGLSPPAVLVGTLGYQFGGWGLANLFDFMKVDAALWLPYALWAVDGLRLGSRHSGLALALSLAASFLAGMPGIAFLVAACTGAYALARLSPTTAPPSERRAALPPYGNAALFALLGFGMASIWLLPLAEASRESSRQEAAPGVMESQALPTSALLGTVVHDLAGSPTEPIAPGNLPIVWWLTPPARVEAALHANPLEWNTYCGAVVLALALVGLVSTPRRARLPALLLLGTVGFACGWPVFRLLYRLPGLNVGIPTRSLACAWLLWPWLAALGVEAIGRDAPRARATLALFGCAFVALALTLRAKVDPNSFPARLDATLVARYDALTSPADVRARFSLEESRSAAERVESSSSLLFNAGGLLVLLGLGFLRRREARPWLAGGLLSLLVLGEGTLAMGAHFAGRPREGPVFPPSPTLQAIGAAAGGGRVLRFAPGEDGRADVLQLARPNMLEPYGIRDLTPWIVFPTRSMNELFAAFDPPSRDAQGVARLSNPALLEHPLLDLLGVSAILSRRPLESARLEEVFARANFHVYRREGALGPARLVSHAIPSASEDAVRAVLAAGALDLSRETLLGPGEDARGAAPVARDASGGRASPGRIVAVERPGGDTVRIELADVVGGWLVLHEQAYPGWSATVDGEEVAVRRADAVFQAVPLPAGAREVVFRYRPQSLTLGALLSAASLVLTLFLSRRLGL